MNILKQILEEIEHEAMTNKEIGRKQCEGMARAMNIIRSHIKENTSFINNGSTGTVKNNCRKIYKVVRKSDEVIVFIMKNKSDNTYSFVNLTKWHICQCRFKTEEDAIKDMINKKEKGEIIDFHEIGENEEIIK